VYTPLKLDLVVEVYERQHDVPVAPLLGEALASSRKCSP
jgi:hypothetical protein